MNRRFFCSTLAVVIGLLTCSAAAGGEYCVVVSRATQELPEWRKVVEALVAKHGAERVVYDKQVGDALGELREKFPRYTCFVARPSEAGRQFVADVSRLTRRYDDDPYADSLWGIVTGFDADDALRIAELRTPLVIERVAAGTEVDLDACVEGVWYCELNAGKRVEKLRGKRPQESQGAADSTAALVDTLNKYQAQLFVTSGHATERDWQIGFRYPNGTFRSGGGELFGQDTQGRKLAIDSKNPKVYLPVGNCLMGHIDGQDAMALGFLHRAGVVQMIGYTVPTWYGYGGWGLLDYFVEQPGRFTLAEAQYANQQALVHRAETFFPGLKLDALPAERVAPQVTPAAQAAGLTAHDAAGLAYDSDTVAFYGDPAWSAKMAAGSLAWEQSLNAAEGRFTLEIKPLLGAKSFATRNQNGSQRGGRPIFQLLPERIVEEEVKVIEGADLRPTITDNFVLIPLPEKCDPERAYRVVFQAPVRKAERSSAKLLGTAVLGSSRPSNSSETKPR